MYDLLVVSGFELMNSGCLNGGTALREMVSNVMACPKGLMNLLDDVTNVLDAMF